MEASKAVETISHASSFQPHISNTFKKIPPNEKKETQRMFKTL
jgi:hypothetical protein